MFNNIKILYHQGKQFISDVTKAEAPGIYRGRPVITNKEINESDLINCCPTNSIESNPLRIDLGKCTFCGECSQLFPDKIKFTKDYKISSNVRENLVVYEGNDEKICINYEYVRKEIYKTFKHSLKLRQVSAAGDNSCEMELNACNNVQFDMSRFGIDFVASPRHADGIVITGPISENMAEPLQTCYDAVPSPKIIILVGTDAISGGIFSSSKALNRTFLEKYKIDLFVPGNPPHPLTFINGILDLTRRIK